jgi:TolB-like protein/Flp pilus assembly protein TadD
MHRILHESPPAPSSIAPALPAALDFVLAKALAKEPARRYANARDLDVDLEAVEPKLAAPAATQAPKAKGPRAIAVLPFKNIGGSVDLDYLGVGLADAVITRLASSPDLVVRATSSIARYDKQAVDPLHVARELDVATVLDASFQRAGDRFRATARLVEAPGGQALWAGKIDLKFEDIFDVQDEVALGIANALTARLAKKDFTPSPEAYELYLRSRDAVRFARKEKFIEAMAWLERTVTIEPRYADAWALLGQFRHAMADSGIDPDPRWFAQGEAAFTRALELDPDNFEAQFGMGTLAIVRGQKREAYRRFATVHRIAPNHYPVTHYLAYLYRLCDMWPQFYAAEERAIELDPSQPYPHWAVTRSHLEFGRVEEGRKCLARLRARFPDDERFFALEALAREAEGFPGEAVALLEEHRGRSGFDVVEEEMLAGFLAANGEGDRALEVLRPLAQATWTDMDFAAWAASIHAQLGQADEAFRFLGRATELGNDTLSLFESKTHFGALHGDPRWPEFIAGVRERVAAYQREFNWPPA